MFPTRRLDVYLNDHLAGAMGGIELCRRALRENSGTDLGAFLEGLLAEILEDRRVLEDVAARLDSDRSRFMPAAVWALEKAGRLKLNGQLRGYCDFGSRSEADARTRTGDPFITSEVLYQLSYVGGVFPV